MRIFILFFFSFYGCVLFSQESQTKPTFANNTLYGELGGPGIVYTVSYDRTVAWTKNRNFLASAGIGYGKFKRKSFASRFRIVPLHLSLMYGRKNLYAEAGVYYMFHREWGYSPLRQEWRYLDESVIAPFLGFRSQFPQRGIFVRANVMFINGNYVDYNRNIGYDIYHIAPTSDSYALWFGLSVGYTFKVKGNW